MQGRNLVTFQLNQVASEVEHLGKKMQKLASLQQEIAAATRRQMSRPRNSAIDDQERFSE